MISIEELYRLDGNVALVTGGYGGIGEVVCSCLAAMGARIAIAGHNGERAAACAQSLEADATAMHGRPPLRQLRIPACSGWWTNLSPVWTPGHPGELHWTEPEEKAEEVTEESDYVCDVNLKSAMFQAQAVALHMIRQGTGEKQVHLGSVGRDLEAVKLSMTTPWAMAL
jgi:NAD(P)-dependent dehydrogenase (short-subunit alcohol dehydrogenase family)